MLALYCYRGMTALQITKGVYATEDFTQSNEKYVYGQLNKLEQSGLVARYKPLKSVSKYAVYFLSKKGFELINNQLDIPEGHRGAGWIGVEEVDFGHFTYDIHRPPMRQVQHHLATVDAQISAGLSGVSCRNNLYASRAIYNGAVLRMDAEMEMNGDHYAIEIDRNTESHQQLVAKFDNYLHYFLEQKSKGKMLDIHHIVFVIPSESDHDGRLKRRWQNILAAYYKGLKGWTDHIELHMVLQNELAAFIAGQNNGDKWLTYIERDPEKFYGLQAEIAKENEVYVLNGFAYNEGFEVNEVFAVINSRYSSRNVKACVRLIQGSDTLYYLTGLPCIDVDLSLYNVNPSILKEYAMAMQSAAAPKRIKLTMQ